MSISNIMPEQRVSRSEKSKEGWYVPMADWVIGLGLSASTKLNVAMFIDAANCRYSRKDFEQVLKTYDYPTDSQFAFQYDKIQNIRDVDILTPIKEKDMGEFINSYHNYQVYSADPDAITHRNAEIGKRVGEKMLEKLNTLLSDPNADTSEEGIESFVRKELENWIDKKVLMEQRTLDYLNSLIEAPRKYVDAYYNWWACNEVYTYRRIINGEVEFEVINPMEYYRVPSGSYFVEDDNYGLRRYQLTLQEIIDKFYNHMDNGLTERQLEMIKKLIITSNSNIGTISSAIFMEFRDLFPDKFSFTSAIKFTKKGLLTNTDHYVFKTEVKYGILKYWSNGEECEMEVDETYKLDIVHGDISIEWKWKDEVWEGWRFGVDTFRLYIPPRPIEVPRELATNTGIAKLPYNGISFIHPNSKANPIAYRIKDYIILYRIYTLLEERWITKFKSFLLMPESVLSDSNEMTTEERLQQAEEDGLFPFNDVMFRENPNIVNSFKEVTTTAVVEFIKTLHEIKESFKASAWELANMNDARFGQSNPYKGKEVTKYEYNQALKGMVWHMEMFDKFREKDYMANLDYSRFAWINGKKGSYVNPTTGEIEYVDIDGEEHYCANIGIFIGNSSEISNQISALKDIAFSASQNGNYDVAADAVTVSNIPALKMLIKKSTKAAQDFQQKLATAKEELMLQVKQTEATDNQAQREHEITLKTSELYMNYAEAQLKSETAISINEAKLQIDTNGNGYIDKDEAERNSSSLDARQNALNVLEAQQARNKQLQIGAQNLRTKAAMANKSNSNKNNKR